MNKNLKKGSLTIETALLMPVILLVLMAVLYLFFYIHNRAWLTAAAYESALDGAMESVRPDGKVREKALEKGKELGNAGFYGGENLKVQVSAGKQICVIYDLDMFSVYGGFNDHLQVQGKVKVIKPVSWIRKIKGAADSVRNKREK
mgnify:FL=1